MRAPTGGDVTNNHYWQFWRFSPRYIWNFSCAASVTTAEMETPSASPRFAGINLWWRQIQPRGTGLGKSGDGRTAKPQIWGVLVLFHTEGVGRGESNPGITTVTSRTIGFFEWRVWGLCGKRLWGRVLATESTVGVGVTDCCFVSASLINESLTSS